ncbi:MAG: hypothetical protein JWN00_1464 [Actinomycetia bacterium]|nr:hypothetical protein [Actinomycetes bacterium]
MTDRTLKALGYTADPITAPLTYPGRALDGPAALLLDDSLFDLWPGATPTGRWLVNGDEVATLDDMLADAGAAPMSERHPVLAVGSNAAPAQLARKFSRAGVRPAVPITAVRVHGIAAGVSAHISRPGYIPAAPITVDGETSDLFVTWLDDAEVQAMDETEPNYHRVRLPAAYPVTLPGEQAVPDCWVYVSKHGCLLDRSGEPRRLVAQRELISALLGDFPEMVVDDPDMFTATMSGNPNLRERMRELIHTAGLACEQPELTSGRERLLAGRTG